MTVVLDAGGVSFLASDRAVLTVLRERGEWPPLVPAVVLAECLTGDHRRDHAVNRLLAMSAVRDVDEPLARRAAALRTPARRAGTVSAVDAVVVALAERHPTAVVVTSDPHDLRALGAHSPAGVRIRSTTDR
ncbi:MAG: PIN domain-containing protein [Dermatophilaceae bacterium]